MFKQLIFSPGKTKQQLSFKPDLLWLKNLSLGSHFLFDNENPNKTLSFDNGLPWVEHDDGIIQNNMDAISHDSFIGAFNLKTGFLSKVNYAGTGEHGKSISHGLASRPEFVIVKSLDQPDDWWAWHYSFLNKGFLKFNTDEPQSPKEEIFAGNIHNKNAIIAGRSINKIGVNYAGYIFGFSDYFCSGFYNGDENLTIPTKNRPDLLIIKRVDKVGSWRLFSRLFSTGDSMRINSYGGLTKNDDLMRVEFLEKGFRVLEKSSALNHKDGKYIYICLTEGN